MTTRKAAVTALFNILKTSSSFTTASRHMKIFSDVPKAERPALYFLEEAEVYENSADYNPPKRTLKIKAFVYTAAQQDGTVANIDQLNDIMEAFEVALAGNPLTGLQTLNGTVVNARINGQVFKDAGDIDGDGVLVVPLEIILP